MTTEASTFMGPRIVLISKGARRRRDHLQDLRESGFELIERYDLDLSGSEADLISALRGAWGVVAGSERYTRAVLDGVDTLRIIARCGVGYDAVDVAAATRNRVAVVTTPGANSVSVAEFAITLMLACNRRVIELDASVRRGDWRPAWLGRDLAKSTVGLIGLGAIGRAVATRLAAFECDLVAVEPNPDLDFCRRLKIRLLALPELLRTVDIVSIHAALTSSNHHLIGKKELEMLRPGAVLINTARGAFVEHDALVEALQSGHLGAAGLDVFETEPLKADDPLVALPRVVLSSHASASTEGSVARMVEHLQSALLQFSRGIAPAGIVNPEVLKQGTTAAAAR